MTDNWDPKAAINKPASRREDPLLLDRMPSESLLYAAPKQPMEPMEPMPMGQDRPALRKPPLGLYPANLAYERYQVGRLHEIGDAIRRYVDDGQTPIPVEWVEEYNAIVAVLTRG